MNSLVQFIREINSRLGVVLPEQWQTLSDTEIAQHFLQGVNRYFFQTYRGLGTTDFQGEELQYFSEFHKYWEANHQAILNAQINRPQAQLAAQALSDAVKKYGNAILNVTHEARGLSPQAIAQVRFFTANQDFREPPENQFDKYLDDPTRFDAHEIAESLESNVINL